MTDECFVGTEHKRNLVAEYYRKRARAVRRPLFRICISLTVLCVVLGFLFRDLMDSFLIIASVPLMVAPIMIISMDFYELHYVGIASRCTNERLDELIHQLKLTTDDDVKNDCGND